MTGGATEACVVLARGDAEVVVWTLPAGTTADLCLVDVLARLQLAARRLGCTIRLRHPPPSLVELLDWAGLGEVVAPEER